MARRCCTPREHDEVVSDAMLVLLLHTRTPKPIVSLLGFVRALVKSAAARVRRRHRWLRVGLSEGVKANLKDPADEFLDPHPLDVVWLLDQLRGERQRWLLQRRLEGWTAVMMAEAMPATLAEAERQLEELSERVIALLAPPGADVQTIGDLGISP